MTSVAKQKTPTALSEFDSLPDSAHVDLRVVAGLLGSGKSTVWARLKRGEIPQPRRFGGSTRWNVGDLRAMLAGEVAA